MIVGKPGDVHAHICEDSYIGWIDAEGKLFVRSLRAAGAERKFVIDDRQISLLQLCEQIRGYDALYAFGVIVIEYIIRE